MRRRILSIAATVATVIIVASCTDKPAPTAPKRMSPVGRSNISLPGTCATQSALESMVNSVFGSGTPGAKNALDIVKQAATALKLGNIPEAQTQANALIAIILQSMNTLPGKAQALMLVGALQCWTGITTGSLLVMPLDTPKTIISIDGLGGVFIPANSVSEPTLVTVTTVIAPPTPLLITKLDKYPNYVLVSQLSGVTNSLIKPVTVAVCPTGVTDPVVRARLRLGHQSSVSGFEITPTADGTFLNCAGIASSQSKMPEWVKSLASIILPRPLYAQLAFSGGVGGSASEFSPFGPVDPALSFSGGVGGSASEFNKITTPRDTLKAPTSPSTNKSAAKPSTGAAGGLTPVGPSKLANITIIDCAVGTVNSPVDVACRPFILVTTRNGTVFENVPVTWAVTVGGGQIARQTAGPTCGTFSTTFVGPTSPLFGKSSACWTLGALVGVQTVTATPGVGGDAPAGVSFNPTGTIAFSTTASKGTATITLDSLTQIYDGTARNVKVTTAPAGLTTVNVTYNGLATAPTAAGTYAVVATLDNPSWQGTTSGTLTVGKGTQPALTVTGSNAGTYNSTVQLATGGGGGIGGVTFAAGTSAACTVTAAGLVSIISGIGDCAIIATKAGDPNYGPATSTPFVITVSKARTVITISNLSFSYDNTTKPATVTTAPASDVAPVVTYDGLADLPLHARSYAVQAMLTSSNFSADNATATLVIQKAGQSPLTVSGATTATFNGGPVQVTAGGGSGSGAFSFSTSTPALCSVDASSGGVTALAGTGTCLVTVNRALDNDYNAATPVQATIALQLAPQSITFAALAGKTYGDAAFAVAPTASSSLPVAIAAAGNCSASGSSISITGSGSCTVTASQSGDANYSAAPSVPLTFSIDKRGLTASAGSATITYGSAIPPISCTMSGALVADGISCASSVPAASAAGSYTVSPVVTGSNLANYTLTSFNGALTITPAAQNITFGALAPKTYGNAPFAVSPTATSSLPVSIIASGSCQASGSTIAITGAGNCTVTASQLGDGNWSAATSVSQSFAIAKLAATATAGTATMTYGSAVPTISCAVTDALAADGIVCSSSTPTITGAGPYLVTPSVTGASLANYTFTMVNGLLTVSQASQTITFGVLQSRTYGDAPVGVAPTASSLLPVTITASGNCSASGSTISIAGFGSCTVTASQAGDANYTAATNVSESFAIAKLAATATAGSTSMTYGGVVPTIPCVVASALAADGISCTSAVPPVTGAGSYAVAAVVVGNLSNYAMTSIAGVLSVSPASQSITFGALSGKTYGDAQFGVTATATSQLPVSFAASGTCIISGSTVSMTGAGSCTVTAMQGGNGNYNAAIAVSQLFAIAPRAAVATAGSATIEFGATPPTIPCAVTGLTIGDASAVTCASSVPLVTGPGTFPVTPVISPTTPANYNVTPVNGQLTILPYVQSNCFASPITGSAAVALSYPQNRGSIVVACILKTHSGASVINASGNILVQDRGTTGTASPITAFSANNVFRYASNLTWAYTVNTSAFLRGHYYQVTATWNDRSTTTGWFYIR